MKTIYIAGPIGADDEGREGRIRTAYGVADDLRRGGLYPFIPHTFNEYGRIHSHTYECWMKYDALWLTKCDALFRVIGPSPGADREVEMARNLGMPIFCFIGDALNWAAEPVVTRQAEGGLIHRLETELREVHAEMDKMGLPPDQFSQARLRKAALVGREHVNTLLAEQKAEFDGLFEVQRGEFAKQLEERIAQLEKEPRRRKLDKTRASITHKFIVGGFEGYLTVGLFQDGTPGELFFRIAKSGSMLMGMLDSFAIAVSFALQYGVPLEVLCEKFKDTKFEPYGFTSHPMIEKATSIVDYVFRYLELKFLSGKTASIA